MISGSQFSLPQSSATVGRQLGNQIQASQTQMTSMGSNTSGGVGGRPPTVGGTAGSSGSPAFRNPSV